MKPSLLELEMSRLLAEHGPRLVIGALSSAIADMTALPHVSADSASQRDFIDAVSVSLLGALTILELSEHLNHP